jgi:5-methylthioribose kinase
MWLLSADNALEYLVQSGHLPAGTTATVSPLAWGVSNVVLRVDPVGRSPLVVKQSRPQLRTKIEWLSRCERIYREADMLRALEPRLPAGTVPAVRFEDRPNFVLALEAIRADHVVWKQWLLEGRTDEPIAARLGELLATIHGSTVGQPELLPDAADWSLFDELRIDPFYRFVARVHPDLAPAIDALLASMAAHRVCLVHADFSPKNVLVHADGVSLVDFETGHWGDPAFDLGFFLAHLLLKSLRQSDTGSWRRLIDRFWESYQQALQAGNSPAVIDPDATSHRSVLHLAGNLLARIDGKSPVDYLVTRSPLAPREEGGFPPAEREGYLPAFVRSIARRWLLAPPATLTAAWDEFLTTRPL